MMQMEARCIHGVEREMSPVDEPEGWVSTDLWCVFGQKMQELLNEA